MLFPEGARLVVYDTRSFRSSTLHSLEIRPDGLKETNKVRILV